jgi:hypothetical protein
MDELLVYDGHFWININGIVSRERREELKKDIDNTDSLLLVKDELWARIEQPHPTKKQKTLYKAPWRPEDIAPSRSLKKMPGIRE